MSRFMRAGTTELYFVTTLTLGTPTAVQVNAGVELQQDTAELSGLTFTNQPISVPDMGSTFENKIPGRDMAEDTSFTFYEDDTTNPVSDALDKGAVGYIVSFPHGPATPHTPTAGDDVEIWPVVVASNAKIYSADNEAAKYKVAFTVTGAPIYDALA